MIHVVNCYDMIAIVMIYSPPMMVDVILYATVLTTVE